MSAEAREMARTRALHALGLLDTPEEERFDRITRLAAALFEVPIAMVNLVDADRQWCKSCLGIERGELPRAVSFCAHAIERPEALVVPDTLADPRFAANPLVTGPPHLRFYAGQPVATMEGHRVGTLCLAAHEPRDLEPGELALLRDLAGLVESELDREDLATVRAVMDSVAEGIVTFDGLGTIVSANPAAAAGFGVPPEALEGGRLEQLLSGTTWPEVARVLDGEHGILGRRRLVEGRRADGSTFPLELVISAARVRGRALYVAVGQDVTQRRAEERLKDEIVAVVGHELRTPLTSIRGSLGLLDGGVAGALPQEAADLVRLALANTERLRRLVEETLDLERLTRAGDELNARPVRVADLLQTARDVVGPVAEAAKVELRWEAGDARVLADADRIVQALVNLVGNAVKFAPAGTAVTVSAEHGPEAVTFAVADRGRGIPAAQLEAIFERFRQVDASDRREKGGTGLGLPIVRAIVERHGGRVWAESAPGEGATLRFTLPFAAPGAPVAVCDRRAGAREALAGRLRALGRQAVPYRDPGAVLAAGEERPAAVVLLPGPATPAAAATLEGAGLRVVVADEHTDLRAALA